ncbi:hypothetical protein EON76_05570 [bacterium]|nr:MAG: hypothetical protein EON76_05570 [bacterium]
MTQNAYINRYVRFNRRSLFFAVIILFISLSPLFSSSVSAESSDAQNIQLEPSIEGGIIRNTQTISLTTASGSVAISHIRIWKAEQGESAIVVEKTSEIYENELTVQWNTLLGADGVYVIEYSAQDISGKKYVETYPVTVANDEPLVTIGDVADSRTVVGTVSRADVVFRVLIDGQEFLDLAPTITGQLANGNFGWNVAIPDKIQNGKHTIAMDAMPIGGGMRSALVEKQVDVTVLTVPALPNTDPMPVVPSFPSLELAPEIGQFVAPVIRPVGETTQTKLFGVSVDDITQSVPAQPSRSQSNTATVSTLEVRDAQRTYSDKTPVSSTGSGWSLMGIQWYWWVAVVSVIAAMLFLMARTTRMQRTSRSFVNLKEFKA